MSDNSITSQVCGKCRDGIDAEIQAIDKKVDEVSRVTEKRLDAHADDVVDLKLISQKLSLLIEESNKRMDAMEQSSVKQNDRSYDVKARLFYPIFPSVLSTILGFLMGHFIR